MTTATKEPIKKYAAMARPVVGPVVRSSPEVVKLIAVRDGLLGVEAKTRDEINLRIDRLQKTSLISRLMKRDLPYPRLSVEPLKWTKNGMPVFAMFSLDNPFMRINKRYNTITVQPELPTSIARIFQAAPAITEAAVTPWKGYSIFARFSGMIPAPVRTEIKKAEPMFGKGMMFLVAEADFKARSIDIDPLVVGWDGKSLRLITMFDLTTLEKELVG